MSQQVGWSEERFFDQYKKMMRGEVERFEDIQADRAASNGASHQELFADLRHLSDRRLSYQAVGLPSPAEPPTPARRERRCFAGHALRRRLRRGEAVARGRRRLTSSLTPHPSSRWYGVTELGVASPELPGAGSVPDRGENPCEVLTDA